MRVIAGLEPHQGRVLIDQEEVQSLASHRRSIGFVSQDLHLFPHLSLKGNLYLAMHSSKQNRNQKRQQAQKLVELLRISHLFERRPDTFSGGEKQRAALARVLASSPRLLLLDEPFSKLDFRTARYLRSEFKNLQKQMALTTIMVTHDMTEAGELAQTMAVMHAGSLETIEDGQTPPLVNGQGNHFLDIPNAIPCRVKGKLGHGLVELAWAGGTLLIPDESRSVSRITVRRRDIIIGATPPPGPSMNRFRGTIKEVEPCDDSVRVALEVNRSLLFVEMSHNRWEESGLSAGENVHGLLRMNVLEVA